MGYDEIIEEYLKDAESLYPDIGNLIHNVTKLGESYLDATCELLSDDNEAFEYQYMDIRDTIKLIREFLSSIDSDYVNLFDKTLNNGHFDLFLPEDDLIERPGYPIFLIKDKSISVPINYNISDGAVIVHEFMHYVNDHTGDYINPTYEIFTEMISIYFELRYYQFLVDKGYDKKNFYYEIISRADDTFNSANVVYYIGSVLDIYYNTGKINRKNIKFMNKFRGILKEIKDAILDYQSDDFIDCLDEFDSYIGYLIGTVLSFYLLKEPKVSDVKLDYLNKNINNNFKIDDVFKLLNVDLNNVSELIDILKDRLESAVDNVYEKDYSYCRSNRSR